MGPMMHFVWRSFDGVEEWLVFFTESFVRQTLCLREADCTPRRLVLWFGGRFD
jgi:hypothetical protein